MGDGKVRTKLWSSEEKETLESPSPWKTMTSWRK